MAYPQTLKSVELLTTDAFNTYLQTMLDTNIDEDGEKLSDYYKIPYLDESDLETQWDECYQFLKSNSEDINSLLESGYELETILYDFLMTRNGEGVGFWEAGDYPDEIGQRLTASCKQFNPVSMYVGDDGGVYISNM